DCRAGTYDRQSYGCASRADAAFFAADRGRTEPLRRCDRRSREYSAAVDAASLRAARAATAASSAAAAANQRGDVVPLGARLEAAADAYGDSIAIEGAGRRYRAAPRRRPPQHARRPPAYH